MLNAVARSPIAHRIIITSWYDFTLPEFDHRIYREQLTSLRGPDLKKKCDRLEAFKTQNSTYTHLQQEAIAIADGNPRLLEWLSKILLAPGLDKEQILKDMKAEEMRFRESILAAKLIEQQPDDLVQMLSNILVFEVPVPKAAVVAVCCHSSDLNTHIQVTTPKVLLQAGSIG